MRYTKTTWVDRAVQYPLTYIPAAGVVGGTTTFTVAPGTITQAGTPINAANLNNIETELTYLDVAAVGAIVYMYKNIAGSL